MRFPCTIGKDASGNWTIAHHGQDVGDLEVRAASRDEAVEKMRNEIRYRLELCPCTAETYQHIQVEIVESR